jgi:hypothetical protein
MLECHNMDIIPFPDFATLDFSENLAAGPISSRSVFDINDEPGWCLFSIEVRNTYSMPFEVIFERLQEGADLAFMLILL